MKKPYPSSEETLCADLVSLMENSELPPWRGGWKGEQGTDRNLITGQSYSETNLILLRLGALMRGHTMPLWAGAGQAKAKGWTLRKGCKAVRIIRPQTNVVQSDTDETIRSWISYKAVAIFNAADFVGEGVDEAIKEALGQASPPAPVSARLSQAEKVLESWPVPTTFGGTVACYSPKLDRINMPPADAFDNRESYCATWAHEQAHSTGHSSRLKRNMAGVPGSDQYAREELVAELASVLICNRLQIGYDVPNHASYLKHWAGILKQSPRVLFSVLSDARKAADLVAGEGPAEPA